jgi:uncharacterized membrane-anchored protein
MRSLHILRPLALLLVACLTAGARADTGEDTGSKIRSLPWQKGPGQLALGDKADLKLQDGMAGLKEAEGARFLELTGNLPEPGNSILLGRDWWAVLAFSDSGYVKDDEKIDADELLKQIRSQDDEGNAERKKRGMTALYTDGWYMPPHYDAATKRLEWALKIHGEGDPSPTINYTVRLLGRTGYERATLVSSVEHLDHDVAEFKQALDGFDFHPGEKYSEYKPGDRVAAYGLGALVVGGAAAAAVKTGFWKPLLAALVAGWKLVVGAVVACFAAIGKLFKRKQA